jgi:hypothetical protein
LVVGKDQDDCRRRCRDFLAVVERHGLAMAFRLMMSAQKKWRKLDGQNRLPEIIQWIEFRDGLRQLHAAA